MEMNQYQFEAGRTAFYRDKGLHVIYPSLGLGETGEVQNKVKKWIRDGEGIESVTDEQKLEVAKELGDILWYVAALADDLGFTLGHVAAMNLKKLGSRAERGVLGGSGDNR